MRMKLSLLSAFGLVACLLASTANAQTTTTGAIQGVVKDANGALEGVTVVATSPKLQGSQSELTDDDGAYYLANLPPGEYEVVFYYSDTKLRRQNVTVAIGSTTPLNVKMDTGAGGAKEVVIKERSSTIDVSNTKQGTTITQDYTKNVPNRSRDYQGVLGVAAGSQGDDLGIAFSGSGSVENNYVIDGINTTGVTYGDGGSPLINDFIQEIEVITGGYNAEFGRSTGGVVNVVTKTGGNEFHGQVFANARPLEAERENIFIAGAAVDGKSTLDYEMDFGFDLGGPIIKDKVWFYVGFAPSLTAFTVTRVVGTQVDRRINDVRYEVGADGRLMDGDGNPDTDPNPGCELLPAPAGRTTACETDNVADKDAQDFTVFEEIERKNFTSSSAQYQYITKLNFAVNPDNQGQISLIGSPATSNGAGVNGTPRATQAEGAFNNLDASIKWTSKFLDNKLELDAVVGWHHASVEVGPINDPLGGNDPDAGRDLKDVPRIQFDRISLGLIGRNPDQSESDQVLGFCTDNDPTVARDDFPTITNCPVIGYGINSLGGFEDETEDRYTGRITATYRLKAAGHHKFKVGADIEDNHLGDYSGYSGGKRFRLRSARDYWRTFQYARAEPSGPGADGQMGTADDTGQDTCGFDEMGAPRTCNYLGEPGDPFRRTSQTINWAAFVQDSWQILPNFTVNAGVRYEQQRLRTAKEIRGIVDPITGASLGTDAIILSNLIAPRLGALYDWTKEGRSKIYANWGRFYESVPMDINNRAFGGEAFYETYYDARDPAICQPWADTGDPNTQPAVPSDPRTCPRGPSRDPLDPINTPVADQFIGGGNAALQLAPGISSLVQPGLDSQYLDEFVMGVEYELIEDLRLGLSYQNRRMGQVIEDVSTDGANTYIIANPGSFSSSEEEKLEQEAMAETDPARKAALESRLAMFKGINDFDKPRRDYNAVQLTVLKRFSDNFFAQASYTYSSLEGNYPGLYAPDNGQLDPNITSQYDLIELLGNRDGALPGDRPHNFKLDGYYTFDLKKAGAITTGIRLRAISGNPINTLGSHAYYGPNESFILPRGSFGRSDFQTGADLRMQYSRELGKDMRLSFFFDLFNVFNQQVETDVDAMYTQDEVNPIAGGTKEDLNHLKVHDFGIETSAIAQKELNYSNTNGRSPPLAGRFGLRLEF